MAQVSAELARAIEAFRQGRLDEAAAQCDVVLKREPKNFDAVHLAGVIKGRQGELAGALERFAHAVSLNPKSSQAVRNLGVTQAKLGRHEDAIASYKRALDLGGKPGEVCADLGRAFAALARYSEAAETLARAADAAPSVGVFNDLAAALIHAGRHGEAAVAARRGLAIAPDNPNLLSLLGLSQLRACDWSDLAARRRDMIALASTGSAPLPPFALLAICDDPEVHFAAARRFSAALPKPAPRPVAAARGARLRIAYLSADFHEHATAYLMAEMFERHDRGRFDVFAFSYGRDDDSAMRTRLRAAFTEFFDVSRENDDRIARRIRDLGVDVLVDLKGHTQDNRFAILARRPAAVQVHYIGYPGTLGADFVDYMIVDPVIVPPSEARFYSEKLVYLSGSYQVNDRQREVDPRTPTRRDCKLPDDAFVFCCFNNSYKILPEMFDVWMRLLRAVPGSVLWLLADNRTACDNLWREAAARGVSRERLIFAPRAKSPQHLARHRLADLFLDTLPYNAHTTASDALWAGLPVLTCAGRSFAARVAASLLHAVGLPELVTHSLADYEQLAGRLAGDQAALAAIRSKLSDHLAAAPLFDAERTTRQIEQAYVRMSDMHRRGEPPRSFSVE